MSRVGKLETPNESLQQTDHANDVAADFFVAGRTQKNATGNSIMDKASLLCAIVADMPSCQSQIFP